MVNGELIYDLFNQRLQAGWLVGIDCNVAIDLATQKLGQFSQSQPNFIAIATLDPIEFITSLMAGCRLGIPIFLGNPHWGTAEWDRVAKLTAQVNRQHHHQIAIPTGGSSGEIKFAIHSWETLSASVWGFQEFYEVGEINALCILPLYHVSGLMQLWRSLLTDGKLFIVDFNQFCNAPKTFIDRIDLQHYFISLVPTQLSKLLDLDPNWLTQFHTILLGGAPPSLELLTRARIAKLPLALTYGMTETASQVTSLKPAEFLAGNNSCGRVLPHAEIELIRSDDSQASSIRIRAKSLMLGYFPNVDAPTYFDPDDLGTFDRVAAVGLESSYLTILGRSSAKIITGGENVFPIEVIDLIMGTGLVVDVWVLGLPDRYWGQVVTAIYVPNDPLVSGAILAQAIGSKISKYKVPKQWISVDRIPRNSVGKISLQELLELIKDRKFEI
ncbi:AMP-binding protein [Chamaesiphon sp.]|uniref:AMP-binding protein n=1 Tax=Chamaesiphon sp. TaxID=2814140 RepID=UPI0035946136